MITMTLDWVKCLTVPEKILLAGIFCQNCKHGVPHCSEESCSAKCDVCGAENTCKPTTEDWEA